MMKKLFLLLISISTIISCKKENLIPDSPDKYLPGDVLAGITNAADLQTLFDSINSFHLKIESMNGFSFNCNYPKDSIYSIINRLNQKPYINTGTGWSATTHSVYFSTTENAILISCTEFNMTIANQIDFINTILSLNLSDRMKETKYIHLKVPIGAEKYWLNELKKYSFVKWTALNSIIECF